MQREQIVAISIGKTVQKNAPIKYAELIEGQSDADLDEEEYDSELDEIKEVKVRPEYAADNFGQMLNVVDDSTAKKVTVPAPILSSSDNSNAAHDSAHKLNISNASVDNYAT